MGKSGKKNSAAVKKLSAQKQHELKLLIQRLLTIDIDRKANNHELFEEYFELKTVVDQIRDIEQDLKVRTGGGDSRMKQMPVFLQWIRSNGGIFDNIEVAEFPGFGLGLKATKPFKKNDSIITIPRKLFMSLDDPTLLQEPYLTEIPFPPTINVKLAFWLIVEKLNPTSFYRPYIDVLPDRIPNFLQYSVAEMQELKGSCALPYAINQFKKFIRMFAVMHRFIESSKHQQLEQVRQRFTYELFCWSISMIMTRENKIPVLFPEDVKFKNYEWTPEPIMCPVLIPFWDMANHKNGEISTFLYPEIDAVVCSAMDDFNAGDQIFIMYGKRTNAQALIHNGFLYKNNPHDVVKIKLGLNDSDELLEARRKLLEKIDVNPANDMDLLPVAPFISPELLGFVRVFNMNKDQLAHWLESERAADLCHLDCALETDLEMKTWKFLEIRLTILLRSFPTTIADDEALLSERPKQMGHVKSLLVELRLNEKRILRDAVEYVHQRVKN